MNIGARSVPFDDPSIFITHRDFMVKHPTVFTVSSPNAGFMQERLATGQRGPPFFQNSVEVIRMNGNGPPPALQILQSEPHILKPGLIEEINVAIGPSGMDQSRERVSNESKIQRCSRVAIIGIIGPEGH